MIDSRLEVVDEAMRALQPAVGDAASPRNMRQSAASNAAIRAAEPRSPRSRYRRYARSRASNVSRSSFSMWPAQPIPSSASGVSPSARAPRTPSGLPPSRRARGRPTPRPASSRLRRLHGGAARTELLSLLARVLEGGARVGVDQVAGRMRSKPCAQPVFVLCFQQSPGDSTGPEVDVAFAFFPDGCWMVTSASWMRPPGRSTR